MQAMFMTIMNHSLTNSKNNLNSGAKIGTNHGGNNTLPNIGAISGAIITLSLSSLILNSQCEEGARDGIDIWYIEIIIFFLFQC